MKRTALFALAMGLALAAKAQQQQPISPSTPESAQMNPPLDRQDREERLAERQAGEARHDRHCLTQTGSRLMSRDRAGRKCAAATGRSYTADELWQTGATNAAEALRLLDPSFN